MPFRKCSKCLMLKDRMEFSVQQWVCDECDRKMTPGVSASQPMITFRSTGPSNSIGNPSYTRSAASRRRAKAAGGASGGQAEAIVIDEEPSPFDSFRATSSAAFSTPDFSKLASSQPTPSAQPTESDTIRKTEPQSAQEAKVAYNPFNAFGPVTKSEPKRQLDPDDEYEREFQRLKYERGLSLKDEADALLPSDRSLRSRDDVSLRYREGREGLPLREERDAHVRDERDLRLRDENRLRLTDERDARLKGGRKLSLQEARCLQRLQQEDEEVLPSSERYQGRSRDEMLDPEESRYGQRVGPLRSTKDIDDEEDRLQLRKERFNGRMADVGDASDLPLRDHLREDRLLPRDEAFDVRKQDRDFDDMRKPGGLSASRRQHGSEDDDDHLPVRRGRALERTLYSDDIPERRRPVDRALVSNGRDEEDVGLWKPRPRRDAVLGDDDLDDEMMRIQRKRKLVDEDDDRHMRRRDERLSDEEDADIRRVRHRDEEIPVRPRRSIDDDAAVNLGRYHNPFAREDRDDDDESDRYQSRRPRGATDNKQRMRSPDDRRTPEPQEKRQRTGKPSLDDSLEAAQDRKRSVSARDLDEELRRYQMG